MVAAVSEAPFTFEDIPRLLDDRDIQVLLREVPSSTLALALKGASESLVECFTRNLSEAKQLELEDDGRRYGRVRQSQVDDARREIADTVLRLTNDEMVISIGVTPFAATRPVAAARTYDAPAGASDDEARLIVAVAEISDYARQHGLLALERELHKYELSPLLRRCLQMMIDGESAAHLTAAIDAAFVEQQNALEREQRLTRAAVSMIQTSTLGRFVAEHLADLLGRPELHVRLRASADTFV
jgi:hypothetical protein